MTKMIEEITKLFTFTAESQRTQRNANLFVGRDPVNSTGEIPTNKDL
jgi:hypothetical protein